LASDVAGELARTYAGLEQLTKLAKSTSMYGDPAEDIQTLSEDIKISITHMRDQLATLCDFVIVQILNSSHSICYLQSRNARY
jgi:hypothetical protein